MLLPVLSSLTDRVSALRLEGGLAPLRPTLEQAAQWVRSPREVLAPPALRAAAELSVPPDASWADLLRVSLLQRLRELIEGCDVEVRRVDPGGKRGRGGERGGGHSASCQKRLAE